MVFHQSILISVNTLRNYLILSQIEGELGRVLREANHLLLARKISSLIQ
jgi:hypothetical protein